MPVNWIDLLGYAASASVLVTFCMSTMLPLRIVAIASNVLFAAYGAIAHIYPVLVLHLILLPVNTARLVQILRLIKGVRAAQRSELSVESLLPFMSHRAVKAGDVVINKGDKADRMFYLFSGAVEIPELNKRLEPGTIFGEIGIFSPEQKRTARVICVNDSDIYEISESKVKQLYYQNPAFGFAVIQLIIGRLLEHINMLQAAPGDIGSGMVPL
jgi:CRP/FNR family transcriptional regulator, cyclic AMP receptor protein